MTVRSTTEQQLVAVRLIGELAAVISAVTLVAFAIKVIDANPPGGDTGP